MTKEAYMILKNVYKIHTFIRRECVNYVIFSQNYITFFFVKQAIFVLRFFVIKRK